MKILFCYDPLDSKVIYQEYEQEYKCARKLGEGCPFGFTEFVLDGDLYKAVKRIPTFEAPERFIHRRWMLKPNDYEKLYYALQQKMPS